MIPKEFVYLSNFDPDIQQIPMYAGENNFLGRPVNGYLANEIILTEKAAIALVKVQKELKKAGVELVVYDAYRPKKAVEDFYEWSLDASDQKMKELYYPYFNKEDLFDLGFIGRRSAHSRGSTIDLSIIELGKKVSSEVKIETTILRDGSKIPFLNDGTMNMGASVDLFHEVSYHHTELTNDFYLNQRNFLRNIMEKYGFIPYRKEWWHYELREDPFPDTYFDFDITKK